MLPTRWGRCPPRHVDIEKAHSPFPPPPLKCMRAPTVARSSALPFGDPRTLHVTTSPSGLPAHWRSSARVTTFSSAAVTLLSSSSAAVTLLSRAGGCADIFILCSL